MLYDVIEVDLESCPFCGETVFMRRGHATYPTCPWCISDMPDADDLDTPEEVEQMKKGNRAAAKAIKKEAVKKLMAELEDK